jgi:hypothetical protein
LRLINVNERFAWQLAQPQRTCLCKRPNKKDLPMPIKHSAVLDLGGGVL